MQASISIIVFLDFKVHTAFKIMRALVNEEFFYVNLYTNVQNSRVGQEMISSG